MTDIRTKYITKWTILSMKGIFKNETFSNESKFMRLRYIIIKATIIENIFFFNIFKCLIQI